MLVINGKLRANTSLLGAFTNCGVHARFDEKPDATTRCPRKQEVQDFTVYTASAGGILQHGVVVEAIEV